MWSSRGLARATGAAATRAMQNQGQRANLSIDKLNLSVTFIHASS